jgi:LPXTG-site transpeptidase (sortase) family protein
MGMGNREIFQAPLGNANQNQDRPKRTLPIHYPLILAWSVLARGLKRIWKSALVYIVLILLIFAVLFYIVNLDLKSPPKTAALPDPSASFAGALATGDLKSRIGSTDVSASSYNDWAKQYGLNQTNNKYDDDPDGDGLPNYLDFVYGTNPLKSDTDGDGFSDKQELTNGYDPDAPGDVRPEVEISIQKIGVAVPMVWSKSADEASLQKDLESGVVLYPKTASPGQNGNAVISGHSSNYVWAKGDYNHIFKDLNNLSNGDKIEVKTIQENGRTITYHYQVSGKTIASPDDQNIFSQTPDPSLTLSTCWPIGTNLKRLIVKADLVK